MDSYETIKYSNFDKVGQNTQILYDISKDDNYVRGESSKPMKYYTSEFFKNDNSDLSQLSRGIFFSEGYGKSANNIDLDTKFRYGGTSNKKWNGDLPSLPLPTTASFISGQGDVQIEDSILRPANGRSFKGCNPKDIAYYDRSFYIFPEGVVQNPIDHEIVPSTLECGIPTKTMVSQKYKRT